MKTTKKLKNYHKKQTIAKKINVVYNIVTKRVRTRIQCNKIYFRKITLFTHYWAKRKKLFQIVCGHEMCEVDENLTEISKSY